LGLTARARLTGKELGVKKLKKDRRGTSEENTKKRRRKKDLKIITRRGPEGNQEKGNQIKTGKQQKWGPKAYKGRGEIKRFMKGGGHRKTGDDTFLG